MKFIQNEPIPVRNIKEIHGFVPNSKNKHFEYRLAVLSNFLTDWSTLDITPRPVYVNKRSF